MSVRAELVVILSEIFFRLMRILFLSHHYPPETNAPAHRVSEMAMEWSRRGHEVTVVTCAPNNPYGKIYPGFRNRAFFRENVAGIEVIRIWTYIAANAGVVRRSISFVSYFLSILLNTYRLPITDVVVSTSPQFFCGLSGWLVSIVRRRPWVLEIRDIWPDSIVAVGAAKSGLMVKLLRLLERFAYRSADLIVVVSPAFISHIVSMGARKDKIHVVENGVDFKLFEKPSGGSSFRHAHGLEGKTVAAYVGTFGMAHHLQTILEAAEITREDSSIIYLLVGGGSDLANLEHHRQRLALENVVILGQQPRETMPLVWSATDIALVLLRRSPLFLSVIPSKMFEAMAMSRPIILGVDGQARRILDAGGCGVAIEPENAAALAAAVRELASDARSRALFGAAGLDFVRQNYDRRALARRYEGILAGVVDPSHDVEAAEQLA